MNHEEREPILLDFMSAYYNDPVREKQYHTLNWEEIGELSEGQVDIGSHTHPILSTMNKQLIIHELEESRNRLQEKLGRAVTLLAYPNGKR